MKKGFLIAIVCLSVFTIALVTLGENYYIRTENDYSQEITNTKIKLTNFNIVLGERTQDCWNNEEGLIICIGTATDFLMWKMFEDSDYCIFTNPEENEGFVTLDLNCIRSIKIDGEKKLEINFVEKIVLKQFEESEEEPEPIASGTVYTSDYGFFDFAEDLVPNPVTGGNHGFYVKFTSGEYEGGGYFEITDAGENSWNEIGYDYFQTEDNTQPLPGTTFEVYYLGE